MPPKKSQFVNDSLSESKDASYEVKPKKQRKREQKAASKKVSKKKEIERKIKSTQVQSEPANKVSNIITGSTVNVDGKPMNVREIVEFLTNINQRTDYMMVSWMLTGYEELTGKQFELHQTVIQGLKNKWQLRQRQLKQQRNQILGQVSSAERSHEPIRLDEMLAPIFERQLEELKRKRRAARANDSRSDTGSNLSSLTVGTISQKDPIPPKLPAFILESFLTELREGGTTEEVLVKVVEWVNFGVFRQMFERAVTGIDDTILCTHLQKIVMRGLCATSEHVVPSMMGKHLDVTIKSGLQQLLTGTSICEHFSALTPLERVMLTFKHVNHEGLSFDPEFRTYLVGEYKEQSAMVNPCTVGLLTDEFKSEQIFTFAKNVFDDMFDGVVYRDAQVSCLLIVGGVDALTARIVDSPAHNNPTWKFTTKMHASRSKYSGEVKISRKPEYQMWSAFTIAFPRLSVEVLRVILLNQQTLGRRVVLDALEAIQGGPQFLVAQLLACCCQPGNGMLELISLIKDKYLQPDMLRLLVEQAKVKKEVYGKLAPNDLISLIRKLYLIPSIDAKPKIRESLTLQGLLKVIRQMGTYNVKVNPQDHTAKVDKLVEEVEGLKEIYDVMLTVSLQMVRERDSEYQHNQLQCYMAARLVLKDDAIKIFMTPPGQGKTYVMILVARYLIQVKRFKKVLIYTPEELIQVQTDEIVARHRTKGGMIQVKSGCDFSQPGSQNQDDLILLDEADEYIRNHALKFKGKFIATGLNALRRNNVWMVTATMDKYELKVADAIWGDLTPESIIRVKSAAVLLQNKSSPFDITGKLFKDASTVPALFKEALGQKSLNQPVIVFLEPWEPVIVDMVKQAAVEVGHSPNLIRSEEDARNFKLMFREETSGVHVFASQFGRGLDIKLGKSAYVIVVDTSGMLGMTTVEQMVGRSSRNFDTQVGYFIGKTSLDNTGSLTVSDHLRIIDQKKMTSDIGPKILRGILHLPQLNVSIENDIMDVFGKNNGWRLTQTQFDLLDLESGLIEELGNRL